MKSVLISIQPKWCELIASGKKTVEVRKTRPKIGTPFKCYIYRTKGFVRHLCNGEWWNMPVGGEVIGEFVCDRIQKYECEFVDDNCYEEIASVFLDEDGDETGFIEWSNDSHIPYEDIDLHEESRMAYKDLKKYMGMGFGIFYGWHISDLVIYEQPKELREFYRKCEKFACEGCEHLKYQRVNADEYDYECEYFNYHIPITRPPQSWCYVERKEDEGK